ncbi:endo-1,3(4)-beta-glucanase 1 precursor [Polyplosphaeria fusca]|uniref:glucan endo-1,3-beta-D-glucosidase n=1 Tax=Polyplosphaeria fusca TaxID=682080 RepID=A0A9P4QW00_9PLEO|nr:endo-1,3(4)-beta-glucanase 1 precursor [Polyplosphaeria fusca]
MARLACLLAICQATLLHGLPTRENKAELEAFDRREITISSNLDVTTSYSSALVSSLQTATQTVEQSLTGSILTGLPTGAFSQNPVVTPSLSQPSGSLAPIQSTLVPGTQTPAGPVENNIFQPIATDAPPKQIPSRDDHPVKKDKLVEQDVPIGTNKFYANLFLGTQTNPVWTHPYSLSWAKGRGRTYGMAVTHIERSQLAWDNDNTPPRYFIGPIGLQHIVFSAAELGAETVLSVESPTAFSAFANLAPSVNGKPIVSLPCVQGMGFVTALYDGAQPVLNSGTFFRSMKYVGQLNGITYKYQITLEDSSNWLLYATPVASLGAPPFDLQDSQTIQGPKDYIGMIQVAKNPSNSTGEQVYDSSAGAYAVNATLSGSVDGSSGSYTIQWGKDGVQNQTLVMFALPHQVESFDDTTKGALTDVQLVTTTKGFARAVVADKFTMVEPDLPDSIGFAPWVRSSNGGNGGSENNNLNAGALAAVNNAGAVELNEDFDAQTRLNSMYYSGKGLAKFAGIIFTLQTMAKNTNLAAAGLVKLKDAFNVFANNTQPLPLVYDTVWKGVVSSGTYQNGDTGLDFGNTLYNDHHFHYGYFVYTAAVIGYLDPAWLDQGTNRAWVNMLVRDYANPVSNDPFFPFQRSFDWVHGHSWAKGLFESGDGKDQESTSEDTFATYALKMWGKISGDANMEARGNLQLAVQARSLRNYFLLQSDNKVQPERFLPNKVTGILFENKVDHSTYFGANIEFVQGIHMIPLNPSSSYTRPRKFVQEEWDAYFSNGRAEKVAGGWSGILHANLALVDPVTAYEFFASPDFDGSLLDGGASRTWYLAYTAALGGDGVPVQAKAKANEGGVKVATAGKEQGDEGAVEEQSDGQEEIAEGGDDGEDEGEYSDVEGRDSEQEYEYDDDEQEGETEDVELAEDWWRV